MVIFRADLGRAMLCPLIWYDDELYFWLFNFYL